MHPFDDPEPMIQAAGEVAEEKSGNESSKVRNVVRE
jgi:hypothetical protein